MSTLDPELWFHERAAFYVEVQLLYHLNELGVFGVLASGGRPNTSDLAKTLGLKEGQLQTVLEYVHGVDDLLDCDADGGWGLTDFGEAVLKRFGRKGAGGTEYNLFDVRVGAYGPVWAAVGDLLRGEAHYGAEVNRLGEQAAEGVYKVGARMAAPLEKTLCELGVDVAVEWGVTTGLLQSLSRLENRVGIDRSPDALREAELRAGEHHGREISWVEADVFEPDTWTKGLGKEGRVGFFSVHFHELLAVGEDRLVALLQALSASHAGSYVLALEQPRLSREDKANTPRAHWLYSQANELIHHLIGNGRILADDEWRLLFERGGCRFVRVESMEYLGYQLYIFELGAS